MTKPWQSSSWKEKRREFIKDKNCAWCGSKECLTIHHNKTFNHNREHKRIRNDFLKNYFSNNKNANEKKALIAEAKNRTKFEYAKTCLNCGSKVYYRKTKSPKYKCVKCRTETDIPKKALSQKSKKAFRKNFSNLFFQKHNQEIEQIFFIEKDDANKKYFDFEDVTILCRRCHFAFHKGLVLCLECKKKYHKPKYTKCWDCFKKTGIGKKIIVGNELLSYIHPWCKKQFKIKGKFWETDSNPNVCCLEYCEEDCVNCTFSNNNWE